MSTVIRGEVRIDCNSFRFALYDNVEKAWRIVDHALKGEMSIHE